MHAINSADGVQCGNTTHPRTGGGLCRQSHTCLKRLDIRAFLQRMSKCTKSCFFLSSDNTDIGDDPRRSRSLGDEPRVGGFEKKCTAF